MQLDSLLDTQNSQTAAFKCSCALYVFTMEGTRGMRLYAYLRSGYMNEINLKVSHVLKD